MTPKVLWLVTARSGSKGLPGKNVKPLGGRPLLAHRVVSAREIAPKEDVWISTESAEYARIAESFGASAPFLRPEELATDSAKSADVALHAMRFAETAGRKYGAIAVLEPTSPFITSAELFGAAELLFSDPKADAVVATRRVRPSTFYVQEESRYLDKVARNIASAGALRRQDEKPEITMSGGFYIAKWEFFKKHATFYSERTLAYTVPNLHGLEIDEPADWAWAEYLVEKGLAGLPAEKACAR